MLRHVRRSKLYVKNAWLNDPINPFELMRLLPKKDALSLAKDLIMPSKTIDQAKSFEEYILARYGRVMHQNFFRPSTEKSSGFRQRNFRIMGTAKGASCKSIQKMDGKSRKYFAYFYYPLEGGYGSICDAYYRNVKGLSPAQLGSYRDFTQR